MRRTVVCILFLPVLFIGCTKVDIKFGDQFLDNEYTQVIKVDSFAVDLSTVYVDSFVSAAKGVSLVGGYADPVFGRISIRNYFEIAPPAYVDSFANTGFDSLVLLLRPDGSYYGDTSQPLRVIVNRLDASILGYDDNAQALYNTRQFPVRLASLAERDIVVRPHLADTIRIRLSDNLGREFLQKLQNASDIDMQSTDAFLQYFQGLRLSSNATSQLVIGCGDSAFVRLYYTKPGLYLQHKTVDFTLANKSHHFNSIQADRSGTILKDLASVKQLNSVSAGNAAYSQYASGAMIKIRFPTIRDVLKLPNYAKILKATLLVRPVPGTYDPLFFLPPELRLSKTTQLNQLGSDVLYPGTGSSSAQTGSLVTDYLFGENTNYAYDVTEYLRGLVTDATVNNNGLLLVPPEPALTTRFSRLVAGNASNSQAKTQLLILYAAVQ